MATLAAPGGTGSPALDSCASSESRSSASSRSATGRSSTSSEVDHRRRRPERLRQVQHRRRHPLVHGRAERQAPARQGDGGRDLRGLETRGPAPMAEVSLTFDDVGFSHETLELAQALATRRRPSARSTRMRRGARRGGASRGGRERRPRRRPAVPGASDAPARGRQRRHVGRRRGQPDPVAEEEVAQLLADQPPAIDFARYTEVTITRRLYRDGTSSYFINKTPCRLRDVTDFFLGTGVGTKAYAIIEQGRIGQIVSSRPQDRRAIIEEAAGITKFKAKKKAAEKKLDQTRQNLMRVSDIVDRARQAHGHAAAPGPEGRALPQVQDRDARHRAVEGGAPLARAGWRGQAGRRPARRGARPSSTTRAPRGRRKDAHVVAERAELAVEERRLVGDPGAGLRARQPAAARREQDRLRAARGRGARRADRRRADRDRASWSAQRERGAEELRRAQRRARGARGRGRARDRGGRGARGRGQRGPADARQRPGAGSTRRAPSSRARRTEIATAERSSRRSPAAATRPAAGSSA